MPSTEKGNSVMVRPRARVCVCVYACAANCGTESHEIPPSPVIKYRLAPSVDPRHVLATVQRGVLFRLNVVYFRAERGRDVNR